MDLKHRLGFSRRFSVDDGGVEFIDDPTSDGKKATAIRERDALLFQHRPTLEVPIELARTSRSATAARPTKQDLIKLTNQPAKFPQDAAGTKDSRAGERCSPFLKEKRDVILWKRLPRLSTDRVHFPVRDGPSSPEQHSNHEKIPINFGEIGSE